MPHTIRSRVRRFLTQKVWVALAAVGSAAALTACGSSGGSTAAGSSHYDASLRFSECMRSRGVPTFPDPGSGGGIQITAGSGINPFSPAFKAAQTTCRELVPGALPGANQHPSAEEIATTRQISVCMRQHGVTGFPDPIFTTPSSPAGYSILEDRGGVVLAVPDTINPQSPVFVHAAKVCGFS